MTDQQLQVLVLGGTVYLSREIANQAVGRGHEVTVAARGESGEPPEGVEFVRIDRSTTEGVEPLRGRSFDAVIDVARIPAHVGRVLEVLADDVRHWTFVSSISVYAEHHGTETLEPTPPFSEDPDQALYGRNKVACENLVRERFGERAFIPRPGLIVGEGDNLDRLGYWPLRIAEGGEILAPGRPERMVQWIDVRDISAWILDSAEMGRSGTYDAIGEPIPMEEFLGEVASAVLEVEAIGKAPDFTWVEQDFLVEHGVNPWAGPGSLAMWLTEPEYDGMTDRDPSEAARHGLSTVPLRTTVRRWWESNAESPQLLAGITREKEGAVLGAWHDRGRAFAVPEADGSE